MPLLEVARACKRFGAVAAVDDVSLTIERGVLFALLGPSGWPGVAAGCLLLPAIGEFVIPDLLGGPETLMIGKPL